MQSYLNFSIGNIKILVCGIILALCLSGVVQAAFEWTDASGDHDWNNPANWQPNTVPDGSTWAYVDMVPGATVTADTPENGNLHIGRYNGHAGALTVENDASFKITYWLTLSRGADASLTVNSGTVGVSGGNLLLVVGHNAGYNATLNMNGGLILIQRDLRIGNGTGTNGHVNLYGGRIECDTFVMDTNAASRTIDIRRGRLIVDGDQTGYIQGFIDAGDITAYGGYGTVELDFHVTTPDKTTLRAIDPLGPHPVDRSVFSGPVELSWSLPEPAEPDGTVTCDVYWGTDPVTDYVKVVDGQAAESVTVHCDTMETYYWQVVVYDTSAGANPVLESVVYEFDTSNPPPLVDAGEDVFTWLSDGVVVIPLDGQVTAEGGYTVQWSDISDPSPGAVVFADAGSEDTSVMMTAAGRYTLQLEADDGIQRVSDTIAFEVHPDSCAAARSLPDYVPFAADLNADCRVNILDFSLLSDDWLNAEYVSD